MLPSQVSSTCRALASPLLAALAFSCSLALAQVPPANSDWKDQGVLYLDHSLNARLHPVPLSGVHLGDGFWSSRRRAVTEHGLPSSLAELEEHGLVDNFIRLDGHPDLPRSDLPRKGRPSSDSEVYKWIEAAAWAVASNETSDATKAKLRTAIDSLTSDILGAQDQTGYLDTFFVADKAHLRFTDLTHSYEDYCLGHLLEAGIAYYRATGDRRLLDGGIRFADFVVSSFGPSKRPFLTGHPVLEMALVELYRTTGQARYLDFTRYLLSGLERDRLHLKDTDLRNPFSGRPFTSHTEFEGYAVPALYAAAGATDYFTEAGDSAYKRTVDLLWNDLTSRKMYITGGVGSRASGDSFGAPYELPAEPAYAADACAATANVMWNFRLLSLTGDARYADVLEKALYNGVNAGISLSGNSSCDRNSSSSAAEKLRNPGSDLTCCATNLERLFESLPGYFYGLSRDGLYVNLYGTSDLNWRLEDGTGIKLVQTADFPWTGDVRLTITPSKPVDFSLYIRWPGWASSLSVDVNGAHFPLSGATSGSYLPISRRWQPGDTVSLSFGMQPVFMVANPRVTDDYGRVALERGPLVYALEQIDQNGSPLGDIFYRPGSTITPDPKKDLFGGVILLKSSGQIAEKPLEEEPLYQPLSVAIARGKRPVSLIFIPYYTVGNREPGPMEVWIPMARSDTPAPFAGGTSGEHRGETR